MIFHLFSNRFMYVGSRSNHSCGCNDAIYQLSFSVSHVRGVWYCCTWGSNGLISSVIGTCWVYLGMADLLTFVEWSSTVDGFVHFISYSQFIAFPYHVDRFGPWRKIYWMPLTEYNSRWIEIHCWHWVRSTRWQVMRFPFHQIAPSELNHEFSTQWATVLSNTPSNNS